MVAEKKEKKPLQLRNKKKMGAKTKTGKDKCQVKKQRHRNWNSVTVDDPEIQHMLVGRPRKIKDANELLVQFNEYLASCIEKTRKAKLIPIKTEEVKDTMNLQDDDEEGKKVKGKAGLTKVTNNVVSQFEIINGVERAKTPTIGGFLLFLGGVAYKTWGERELRDDLSKTVEEINNILETIRVDEASKWNINPSIAALVLNVRYNRIPKKEVDNNIKGSIFKESDFIDD